MSDFNTLTQLPELVVSPEGGVPAAPRVDLYGPPAAPAWGQNLLAIPPAVTNSLGVSPDTFPKVNPGAPPSLGGPPSRPWSPPNPASVIGQITAAAQATGVDLSHALTTAHLESGMGQAADTPGSQYRGIYQLNGEDYRRAGTTDPVLAGVRLLAMDKAAAERILGRSMSLPEAYMTHVFGVGGGPALLASPPGQSAVDAMLGTAEGREKGLGWAQQAIRGNMTPGMVQQYGLNPTAQQLVQGWRDRYGEAQAQYGGKVSGQAGPSAQAQAQGNPVRPPTPQSPPGAPDMSLAMLAMALPNHKPIRVDYDPFKLQAPYEAALRGMQNPQERGVRPAQEVNPQGLSLFEYMRAKGFVK